jgi:hypothetical protein
MSLIDSEAAFDSRCDKLEVGLKDLFHAQSINTFSSLAFAVGTPQESVNDADMKAFTDKIFTREATIGEVAYVKRLHFEASTVASRFESTDYSRRYHRTFPQNTIRGETKEVDRARGSHHASPTETNSNHRMH